MAADLSGLGGGGVEKEEDTVVGFNRPKMANFNVSIYTLSIDT